MDSADTSLRLRFLQLSTLTTLLLSLLVTLASIRCMGCKLASIALLATHAQLPSTLQLPAYLAFTKDRLRRLPAYHAPRVTLVSLGKALASSVQRAISAHQQAAPLSNVK